MMRNTAIPDAQINASLYLRSWSDSIISITAMKGNASSRIRSDNIQATGAIQRHLFTYVNIEMLMNVPGQNSSARYISGKKLHIGTPRSKMLPAVTFPKDNSILAMLTQSHIENKDKRIATV